MNMTNPHGEQQFMQTNDPNEPPSPPPSSQNDNPESYESTHVHAVYEAIAPHFSATRHKPWPLVHDFLTSLPPGSIGLDAGCGNGKYLPVNRDVWLMGSDRSANLVALARDNHGVLLGPHRPKKKKQKQPPLRKKGKTKAQIEAEEAALLEAQRAGEEEDRREAEAAEAEAAAMPKNQVLVADSLDMPFRRSTFDFAISIAVLHHMSTAARRRDATRAILDCLRPAGKPGNEDDGGGKAMLFVWALEQGSSRRGWDESAVQDQLVPWVTKGGGGGAAGGGASNSTEGPPSSSSPATQTVADTSPSAPQQDEKEKEPDAKREDATWHRYYHLYKEGELEEDIRAVGGLVLDSGYDRDNWWAICSRGPSYKVY